jgi:hypothetical protein
MPEQGTDVRVSIPNDRRYFNVAYLTLGDSVSRTNLGYEAFDELQLALETVLSSGLSSTDELSIELHATENELSVWVGPFDPIELPGQLDASSRGLALRRVLERLVDSAEPCPVADEHGLLLVKRVPERARATT